MQDMIVSIPDDTDQQPNKEHNKLAFKRVLFMPVYGYIHMKFFRKIWQAFSDDGCDFFVFARKDDVAAKAAPANIGTCTLTTAIQPRIDDPCYELKLMKNPNTPSFISLFSRMLTAIDNYIGPLARDFFRWLLGSRYEKSRKIFFGLLFVFYNKIYGYSEAGELYDDCNADLFVIGSHLGGTTIFSLLFYAHEHRKPIISIWQGFDYINKLPIHKRYMVSKRGNRYPVPGFYSEEHMHTMRFVATNGYIRDHLIKQGIPADRVFVAPPEFSNRPPIDSNITAQDLRDRSHLPFLYTTEVIQELTGRRCLKREIALLSRVFSDVAPHKVIVRLHPREPESVRGLYRSAFASDNIIFDDETELKQQIEGACCVIGKFSQVLFDSASMGVPLAIVNFMPNRLNNVLLQNAPVLQGFSCSSPAELRTHLQELASGKNSCLAADCLNGFRKHLDDGCSEMSLREFFTHVVGTIQ